jgi:hypothetical protein
MKTTDFELISQVNQNDEGYFTWRGCDNSDCETYNLGCTVFDCHGYKTLAEAQSGPDNLYEFALCFDCLYEYEYGERPEH